jgi:hypothetical protein
VYAVSCSVFIVQDAKAVAILYFIHHSMLDVRCSCPLRRGTNFKYLWIEFAEHIISYQLCDRARTCVPAPTPLPRLGPYFQNAKMIHHFYLIFSLNHCKLFPVYDAQG